MFSLKLNLQNEYLTRPHILGILTLISEPAFRLFSRTSIFYCLAHFRMVRLATAPPLLHHLLQNIELERAPCGRLSCPSLPRLQTAIGRLRSSPQTVSWDNPGVVGYIWQTLAGQKKAST